MHTIHNITFDVDVNHDSKVVSWEQYYVDFFQEKLLPNVEHICDDWNRKYPNTKCTIESIDVAVEVDSMDLEVLQKEIIQQINRQLVSIQADGSSNNGNIVAKITREASSFDAFIRYISEGILPAYISVRSFKEWLGTIDEFSSIEKEKLKKLFAEKTEAIQRMLSLLRNDYKKFADIIETTQQLETNNIQLETTFFEEFLKAFCHNFKLEFSTEQAKIWYRTLGNNNSLAQFSKTFFLLLQPKAASEGKRFTKYDEKQLSIALLQAIVQYEMAKKITLDTSKVAMIVKDETLKTVEKTTRNDKKEQAIKDTDVSERLSKEDTDDVNVDLPTKEQAENHQEHTKIANEEKNDLSKKVTKSNLTEENDVTKSVENISLNTNKDLTEVNKQRNITKEISLTTEKAGLILLHPFLTTFLKGVTLIGENKEITNIGKACQLLHYLATETEEMTDVELTLEKIMLGIPLETIIDTQTPLTENDKKCCEELLQAVVAHWVVLKKSSSNTLRDMFIKRDGHLKITEESFKLTIERAAQDILLEKIPWNISLFRLTWMEKMMHIEW